MVVEPWLQVTTSPVSYGEKTYQVGDYIPTAYLNTLPAKTSGGWPGGWSNVDAGTVEKERGIFIHNAVFAGGNIALGSTSVSANEITVFGNATASIHDVYNRDLITIGTGHTGGLYGDGNLTLVDGYRELNITNYGTDKYHLANELKKADYDLLPSREKAYYEVKYRCKVTQCTDQEGSVYKNGAVLPKDELLALFTYADGTPVINNAAGERIVEGTGTAVLLTNEAGQLVVPNPSIWEENGVVSTYAGRIMNTIQRADFCGVFGSRMVMKGARDRVPEKEDSKLYTINRVREVSLNKMNTKAGDTGDNAMHGNYFGIYSNVNFLGSLTSDVDFHNTVRTTNAKTEQNPDLAADGKTTFAQWKEAHVTDRMRNNGYCYNQLALASGVYLELTTEKSTGTGVNEKDWGLITGVVELDLINVQTGVGGGYVYAKNQHGERIDGPGYTPLTTLNKTAVSKWYWDYKTADADRKKWETSGNFIHSSQTIIDDCYNISNKYLTADGVPAHYWYISGSVYVYDQYITAHTGAPNAYSETVDIPITINAASNGKMTLMDVQPNLYAYYSSGNTPLTANNKVVINNIEYRLNDPISYWDWFKLSASERRLFVEETYVVREDCKIGTTPYTAGTVLLKEEYEALIREDEEHNPVYPVVTHVREIDGVEKDVPVPFIDVFRSSNNMSHNTGYLLTYDVTNPEVWEPWYTQLSGNSRSTKITTTEYGKLPAASTRDDQGNITKEGQDAYTDGPTYTLKSGKSAGLYGQRRYEVEDIISQKVYTDYETLSTGTSTASYIPTDEARKQATFVPAYVVTNEYTSPALHLYPGAPISETTGASLGTDYAKPAYVCTSTIELSPTEVIYVNELMTADEKSQLKTDYPDLAADIDKLIVPAYYCTEAGLYGGDVYQPGQNYRALSIWSSMTEAERNDFDFNYDALDLLIDPTYGITHTNGSRIMQKEGQKYQYDGYTSYSDANKENMIYSLSKPLDYTATYDGSTDDVDYESGKAMTYQDASATPVPHYVKVGAELFRTDYEALPNEQRHYAPVTVTVGDVPAENYTVYVVHEGFVHVETPYAVGATLSYEEYTALASEEKTNITTLTFSKDNLNKDNSDNPKTTTFYYCRENYQVNEKGMGQSVTSVKGEGSGTTYTSSTEGGVPKGAIIAESDYSKLVNKQKNFTIHGISPMETSTLYVSRESDINDLSSEKIITVIYKYDYEETDLSGLHVTPVSERHIVNIHIKFESGVPIIEDIKAPNIVLPGTSITMRVPNVTPGAYEVTGGGWEIFSTDTYAENHTNGVGYKPSSDPLYWYQDGYLLAYYAKTYLGKTYSNAVPISVANYHDLKKVMDDKEKHLHVDYDRTKLKRDSKIYINDYSGSKQNGLELFKDFYDLSLIKEGTTGITIAGDSITNEGHKLKGHHLLNTDVRTIDGKDVMVGVQGDTNLEFFLRTDLSAPSGSATWTPIASGASEPCFNGTLHGDGHTISGLDHSLFGKLCGNVYNLGVMGSFTSAGVADEGNGYVESCWVKTTGTNTNPLATKPYPVFGAPSDNTGYQTVNSYFWSDNSELYQSVPENGGITFTNGSKGSVRAMTSQEFYNGTVAYDLNSFYLNKRYYDKNIPSAKSYKYKTLNADGTVAEEPVTGYYPTVSDNAQYGDVGYVEERYADDGDFIYAGGTIPTTEDVRHYTVTTVDPTTQVETTTHHYCPIWPDDYLFFGQKLTYGYSIEPHQEVPSAIAKSDGRLSQTTQANRVYRAPAYYRNSTMDVAHFNPNAYLAQKSSDGLHTAYPGMTAIDFAGHQGANEVNGTYGLGLTAAAGSVPQCFYPPLLDDDGLQSIVNQDETDNLLVYAPAAASESGYANAQTLGVLSGYFIDPVYNDYYDNTGDNEGYRIVRENTSSIHGHLVQSNLIATNDHKLVDKMDFNAPMAYTFDERYRMWYQRTTDNQEYVDHTAGWQGISLPFTAELVTTNQKGEITHFYSGSHTSKNSDAKIGHEYWLREFKAIDERTEGTPPTPVAYATFNYPDARGATTKTVTNHFLWDYYYFNQKAEDEKQQKDANDDKYLDYTQRYYERNRTFSSYPLLANGTPYLLGLPGPTYYEFDLSGQFEAQNTASAITQLGKQVITFASDAGASIGVSDNEMVGVKLEKDGTSKYYTITYKPSYLNENLANGNYVMNSDGDAYVKLDNTHVSWITSAEKHTFADEDALNTWMTSNYDLYTDPEGNTKATTADGSEVTYYQRVGETTVNDTHAVTPSQLAFRPYFVATSTTKSAGVKGMLPEYIVFSGEYGIEDEPESAIDGSLEIYARGRTIITTSHMKEATTIRIVNAAGITLANFVLEPGKTVETPINVPGVYIVNQKKLSIK